MTRLATTSLFATRAWTAPTPVGTTLYARDGEQIVALDLGKCARAAAARGQRCRSVKSRQGIAQVSQAPTRWSLR